MGLPSNIASVPNASRELRPWATVGVTPHEDRTHALKPSPKDNVQGLVPLLSVGDMERSLAYYVEHLGFTMTKSWVVDGRVRWCWMELGGAALMLQGRAKAQSGNVGDGVSLWFQCKDALAIYDDFHARGVDASEPEVGNAMWNTTLVDPDGYRLHFGSETDVPEDTKLSEVRGSTSS
jgi:lactoylglutathione lyase